MDIKKPIIFIGFPRSGTSIISEIIFQHEHLAWPSNYQDKYPNSSLVNRVRPFIDNRFWRFHGQKPQLNKVPWYNRFAFKPSEAYNFWESITGENIDFSRGFLLNTKVEEARKGKIISRFKKIVRFQNRKRLAFKITGPGRISYLNSIFPDAVFIEITREPFATIRSLMKVPFWENKNDRLYWQGAYTDDEVLEAKKHYDQPALLAAIQYKRIKETIADEKNTSNVNYHVFDYENFIREPEVIIEKILELTSLPKSKLIDEYLENNKIINRNINAEDFFPMDTKNKMKEILQGI